MADTLFDVPPVPGLPDLVGSEAQVKWANDIRPKKIRHCRDEISRLRLLLEKQEQRHGPAAPIVARSRERLRAAFGRLERLEATSSAHWWIETRDATAGQLLGLE